jgi:hypothetical protein
MMDGGKGYSTADLGCVVEINHNYAAGASNQWKCCSPLMLQLG